MNDYIDCRPVLVPIQEHSYADKYYSYPVIWTAEGYKMQLRDKFLSAADMQLGYKAQHLYLVSDRKIEEGDYGIQKWNQDNRVVKVGKITHTYGLDPEEHRGSTEYHTFTDMNAGYLCHVWHYKKVEATTDPSLGLPLIPQSFIEEYVQKQGKIDKVRVETINQPLHDHLINSNTFRTPSIIGNEVIILPAKDSWNREEFRKEMAVAYEAGVIRGAQYPNAPRPFDEWFDKNY